MSELSYQDRIASQIAQYAETVNMHDLPEIFHVWSNVHILPGLKEVFGTDSVNDFYARAFIESRDATRPQKQFGRRVEPGRILSIGCGDGGVEIAVSKILIEKGIKDFQFVCADLSPILLGHLKAAVVKEGLDRYFEPVESDLNQIAIPGHFDMIMANHSLHHIEGLEALFSYSHERLKDGGIFATSDMIGRNGHMRWPETESVVQAIWPLLKPEQRYQVQLQRLEERYINHDCSTEGFEGIRAQDILPLMIDKFHPYRFMACGGFIDLLVDRGYGHGFKRDDERDVALIEFLGNLNDMMLDSGMVKPTIMLAWFTKDNRGEFFFRDRRARSCVRPVGQPPDWTRFQGL